MTPATTKIPYYLLSVAPKESCRVVTSLRIHGCRVNRSPEQSYSDKQPTNNSIYCRIARVSYNSFLFPHDFYFFPQLEFFHWYLTLRWWTSTNIGNWYLAEVIFQSLMYFEVFCTFKEYSGILKVCKSNYKDILNESHSVPKCMFYFGDFVLFIVF